LVSRREGVAAESSPTAGAATVEYVALFCRLTVAGTFLPDGVVAAAAHHVAGLALQA
jgi:hypothetical protein